MKKNSFVEGTFIATFAIILVKILGMLYVIPFYKIIGEDGGALYSYAYNVYNLFLNISTAGLPIAVSKIISEYNTLEMYEAKERAYKLGRNIIFIISLIAFFFLFVFAEDFARLILGEITGGNTLKDVGLVIRCISFCLLIIPFLSVSKGYLQGHKYITPSSVSQIIEQVVRIAVILFGSFVAINVLQKSVSIGVGVACLGAFFGGLIAYFYIRYKIYKNKDNFNTQKITKKDKVENKEIIKKIISYAVPLIIVSIATDIYSITDMTLVVRASYSLGYTGAVSETISSIIATWSPKICMIINAVAMGLTTSLIPHMVSSVAKKDYKSSESKFNQAISIIIFATIPLALGLSFLSEPVYYIFYGISEYGGPILKYTSFVALFASIYIVISMALQGLNKFKVVYLSTILGFLVNALLDIPLMYLFNKLGLEAFYGSILATILGYVLSYIIALTYLKKELKFNYRSIRKNIVKTCIPSILMVIALLIVRIFIPLQITNKLNTIVLCVLYALVGGIVYIFTSYKLGLFEEIFGSEFMNRILRRKKKC